MTAEYDRWRLKDIFDLKQLEKLFGYFSMVTNMDVALFDFAGCEVLAVRKENSVCHYAKNGAKCREHISADGMRSCELGAPYICACACGLVMCFSPVMYKGRFAGSIALGPALLWEADEIAIKEFQEKTRCMDIDMDVHKLFASVTACACANITSSAQVLFAIVNSLTREPSVYLGQMPQVGEQQARIAESLVRQKKLSEYIARAIEYMTVHYAEDLTLKMVSDATFVSSCYLSHLFRKEMNTTFSNCLCKIRIEKAKILLRDDKNPRIHEIAEKTGFNDPNYFAKSFKKIAGVSPREYKKVF